MKKNFFKFVVMMATVLSASAFVSCSEDEEDVNQITEGQEIESIKVYDRWGKQIYNVTPAQMDSMGGIVKTGDYWYEIQYEGSDKVCSGHFTMME